MNVLSVSYKINNTNFVKPKIVQGQGNRRINLGEDTYAPSLPTFTGNPIPYKRKYINTIFGLKELAKAGHQCCIWCGNPMFHSTELDAFQHVVGRLTKSSELFSRVMMHFKDYLPPEYAKLMKKISVYSAVYPNQSLKSVLQKMLPEAQKNLEHKQFFVFHKIRKLRSKLPEEVQKEFDILLEESACRVSGEPYIATFSAKEFSYQLNNLSKRLLSNTQKQRVSQITGILTHPALKENSNADAVKFLKTFYRQLKIDPHAKGNYISPNDPDWRTKANLLVVKLINEIGQKQKEKEICKLCDRTVDIILQKPTVIPFSNKAFGYKLNEILEGLNNKELQEKFNQVTKGFPTSLYDMNAFLVKNKNVSEETWLSNLLKNSEVTLEHLVPILRNTSLKQLRKPTKEGLNTASRTRKGADNIGNWALAHAWCNVKHGCLNIKGDKFPFSKEAGIKYFQTLIQDANDGLLAGETVINMARSYFDETGIRINLKGLKYTPEY